MQYSQSYGFSCNHARMWELTIKKAECRRIDALEPWCWRRLLRVPWTERRSNQSILKKNQPWILLGRTDAEAPILWPPDVKNQLTGKTPDAGKDWRHEEKRVTKDEMVGWHHWLNGHEFKQALGDSEEHGSLACCSPRGHKESDMTEQLNWCSIWRILRNQQKTTQFLKKLNTELNIWPSNSPPTYQKELKHLLTQKVVHKTFTAALIHNRQKCK